MYPKQPSPDGGAQALRQAGGQFIIMADSLEFTDFSVVIFAKIPVAPLDRTVVLFRAYGDTPAQDVILYAEESGNAPYISTTLTLHLGPETRTAAWDTACMDDDFHFFGVDVKDGFVTLVKDDVRVKVNFTSESNRIWGGQSINIGQFNRDRLSRMTIYDFRFFHRSIGEENLLYIQNDVVNNSGNNTTPPVS